MPVDFKPNTSAKIDFKPAPKVEMPNAGKTLKSGLSKLYDWGTTSLTGIHEPTMEEWQKDPKGAAWRSGVAGMTTPISIAGEFLGGAGLVGKKLGLFGKVAPVVAETLSPAMDRARNIIEAYEGVGALKGKNSEEIIKLADSLDPLKYAQGETPLKVNVGAEPEIKLHKGGSAYDDQLIANLNDEIKKTKNLEFVDPDIPPGERLRQFAELSKQEAADAAKKPKLRANTDGTFTNLETGEIIEKPKPNVRSTANEVNINSGNMPNVKKGRAERIRTTDPTEGRRMLAQMAGNEPPTITPPNDTPIAALPQMEQGSLGFGKGTIPPEPPKNIFSKGVSGAGQVLSEARQAQTSFDLSAPFRQGINAVTRAEFWNNLAPMVKSAFSPETFKAREAARMASAEYPILEQAGVEFTNLDSNLARREEQLRGKWLEKIPGFGELIKGSNRGYTEFTNSLRFDMGKRMLQDARAVGADADFFIRGTRGEQKAAPTLKAIGNYINDATGRGNLGRFEKSAVELNQLLFSPKLIASRVNMLNRALDATVGSVGGKTGIIKAGVNPAVAKQLRMEALRSMAGVGGLAVGSIGISKLMDSKGSEDPRSTDFGKIKVGNTRLDFTGGYQQYVRLAAQLATHQVNREGKISDANRADTAGRFAWAKLSPMASLIVDNWKGKNIVGEKFEWTPELRDRIVPLIAQDLYEISQSDPSLFGAAAGTAAFLGAGSQSYEPRTYGRKGKGGLFSSPKITLPKFSMPSVR